MVLSVLSTPTIVPQREMLLANESSPYKPPPKSASADTTGATAETLLIANPPAATFTRRRGGRQTLADAQGASRHDERAGRPITIPAELRGFLASPDRANLGRPGHQHVEDLLQTIERRAQDPASAEGVQRDAAMRRGAAVSQSLLGQPRGRALRGLRQR